LRALPLASSHVISQPSPLRAKVIVAVPLTPSLSTSSGTLKESFPDQFSCPSTRCEPKLVDLEREARRGAEVLDPDRHGGVTVLAVLGCAVGLSHVRAGISVAGIGKRWQQKNHKQNGNMATNASAYERRISLPLRPNWRECICGAQFATTALDEVPVNGSGRLLEAPQLVDDVVEGHDEGDRQ